MKMLFKKLIPALMLTTMLMGISACQKEAKPSGDASVGKENTGQESANSEKTTATESGMQEKGSEKQSRSNLPIVFIENGFYGLKDASGNVLAEAKYDFISEQMENERVLAVKDRKWGFLGMDGKEVIALSYERAFPFFGGLAQVMMDGKYGFINPQNEVMIEAEYQEASNLKFGFAKAKIGEDEWVLLDKTGNKLSTYESISDFSEGRARFQKNGKYGFLDENGQEIIPAIYDKAASFFDSFTEVKKGENFGLIDKAGKELLPFEFSSLQADAGDQIWFVKDNEWGMMKIDGTVVIPGEYAFFESFEDGVTMSPFSKDGELFGFIDKNGKQLTDFIYEYGTNRVSEGAVTVLKDGLWGILDGHGQEILPPSLDYEEVYSFSQGLAMVSKDGKCGYIDKKGQLAIPMLYEYPGESFADNGITVVSLDGKRGCIDTKGNLVVPAIYDNIPSFEGRVISVTNNELNGCVDLNGKEIIPLIYEDAIYFTEGLAEIEKDGQKLLFSETGHILYQK